MALTDKLEAIADSIRLKSGKTDKLTLDEMPQEIEALSAEELLKANDYPTYVTPEVLEVVNKVRSVQQSDSITFIAMSDSHYPAEQELNFYDDETIASTIQANQAAKVLTYLLKPDFFAHLGDVSVGADSTTPEMLKTQIEGFINYFREARSNLPMFVCIGNHDTGIYYHRKQTDGAIHTTSGDYLYNNFTAYSKSDDTVISGEENGGYCYRDFADKKLRVIMLNTSEKLVARQTDCATFGSQRLWLANVLFDLNNKTDAVDWGFVILSHYPADYGETMPLSSLLEAYVKGASFTITDLADEGDGTNQSVNFSGKNGARFIAQFHGHIHNFLTSKLYGRASGSLLQYDGWRICIPNGQYNRENSYGDLAGVNFADTQAYGKTFNTANGTSFVVNVINPSELKIYSFCYGAGYDRTVSIDGLPYYNVNKELTYASITGESGTSIEEGSSYSGTIVPDDECTLKNVIVTMGGVDVTTDVYNESTGIIYIENVTGNVIITVIAVAPPEDLIPRALASDGVTIYGEDYNGDGAADGYKKGVMVGSVKEYTEEDDADYANGYCTGWIPVIALENTIVIKNVNFDTINYTKARVAGYSRTDFSSALGELTSDVLTPDDNGNYVITPDMWSATTAIKYIRVSGSYIGEDSSVTINEPIEYGA